MWAAGRSPAKPTVHAIARPHEQNTAKCTHTEKSKTPVWCSDFFLLVIRMGVFPFLWSTFIWFSKLSKFPSSYQLLLLKCLSHKKREKKKIKVSKYCTLLYTVQCCTMYVLGRMFYYLHVQGYVYLESTLSNKNTT